MSEPSDSSIKIELPELKREFVFESPQKLLEWQDQLRAEWGWLNSSPTRNAWSRQEINLTSIKQAANDWMRNPDNPGVRDRVKNTVHGAFQQMFSGDNPLFGNKVQSIFIKDVLQKYGRVTAAGVFATLSRTSDLQFDNNFNESFFGGLLRGFLFENEIDWTASAHRKVLEELEIQYKQGLEDQKARIQRLENENLRLNEAHDSTLKAKTDSLDELNSTKASFLMTSETPKKRHLMLFMRRRIKTSTIWLPSTKPTSKRLKTLLTINSLYRSPLITGETKSRLT